MRRLTIGVIALLFAAPVAFGQAQPATSNQNVTSRFEKAEYFQATTTGQKKAAKSIKGALVFNNENRTVEFAQKSGSVVLSVSYDAIKSLTYEQASKPRYLEAVLISPFFLLSHSKKHYLTMQYTSEAGEGKFAIFRLDKKNAREAVARAEAETGQTVEQVAED